MSAHTGEPHKHSNKIKSFGKHVLCGKKKVFSLKIHVNKLQTLRKATGKVKGKHNFHTH